MNTIDNTLLIFEGTLWIQERIDWAKNERILHATNDLNMTIRISVDEQPDRVATGCDVWLNRIVNHKLVEIQDVRCTSRTFLMDNGWWYKECYEQDGDLMFDSCGCLNYKSGTKLLTQDTK